MIPLKEENKSMQLPTNTYSKLTTMTQFPYAIWEEKKHHHYDSGDKKRYKFKMAGTGNNNCIFS